MKTKRIHGGILGAVVVAGLTLAIGLVAPAAHAAKHAFGKSSVWTPDDWKVKSGKVLRATPPNKRGLVAFETTGQTSLGQASKQLGVMVRKYVGSAKHGAVSPVKVGSHDAVTTTGVGNMDGMVIRYRAYLYKVGGKVVLGIAFAPKAAYGTHAAAMGRILQSLR